MPDLEAFEPSAGRAWLLDARMRQRLALSLRYICAQAASVIAVPAAAMEAFLARLAAGPVSPRVFGAYCDLVLAIDADALDEARALLDEICAAPGHSGGPFILALADPDRDRDADRYRRLVDTDPGMPFRLRPPPPALAEGCGTRIAEALALLDAGCPALAAEIRALLREIVLAVGPDDPEAALFDGASAFMLWGAIVLNAASHETALDMVQALAHESGHNLLFGLSADGPLVENGDDERYASPLRSDPRPMDGIFHATYVTARMHLALGRLAGAGMLAGGALAAARHGMAAHERAFAAGIETIRRHGRLTARGQAVMAGAAAYMAAPR